MAGGDVEKNPLLSSASSEVAVEGRTVSINNPERNRVRNFAENEVSTTKYNVVTFLPKNLWEQFQRIANIYFLLISLLQIFVPEASPTGKYNTFFTLAFVLLVTAVKEGYDDYRRFCADVQQNERQVKVLRASRWRKIGWSEVVVGDIVKVGNEEEFPADMVLLCSSSSEDAQCFIETSNLDGETNLKIRRAPQETCNIAGPSCETDAISALKGVLDCQSPSINMYTFEGRLKVAKDSLVPLDLENTLLRGCRLRNTQWVVAVVVYTGHDTKIMLNSTPTRFKQSSLEKVANTQIIMIFIFEIALCIMGAVASSVWANDASENVWYLAMEGETVYTFESFITFFILVSNLIPISLYVTMELMKVALSMMLELDIHMYDEATDTPAQARTTNLNEELGQVEYIFSDKTGTLTQNVMEFRKCSIGGYHYSSDDAPDLVRTDSADPEWVKVEASPLSAAPTFKCEALSSVLADKDSPEYPNVMEFFCLLALCHTAIPEEDDAGNMVYQASSPDDLALVDAAKSLGFTFVGRTTDQLTITIQGETVLYQLLAVLDFTSDRKRMSVVVRSPDGQILLYSKGADSVIFPLLRHGTSFVDVNIEHLQEYAAEGLRTLCAAKKVLDEATWEAWNTRFLEAKNVVDGREAKTAAVMAELEVDMELMGATAIEDKLQDGVPDTIHTFLQAGIKVWMLTGDKMETAVNIGFSCRLLDEGMMPLLELNTPEVDQLDALLQEVLDLKGLLPDGTPRNLAVILGGPAMDTLFDFDSPETEALRIKFVEVVRDAKAVVGCRCSPIQKAEVVELMQGSLDTITLGIGDGANDVSMLQAAHVGVGISGREGLQAVNSSDYAIAQFSFLQRLLLVHGRQSYRRLSKLMLYCFYKQVVFNLPLYFYSVSAGWSGQSVYEPWSMTVFNMLFTALPIMFFALLDQDVPAWAVLQRPELYKTGHSCYYFNGSVMLYWMLSGIWHAVCILWVVQGTYSDVTDHRGHTNSTCYDMGVVIYTIIILVLTMKLMLETHYYTWINWFGFATSVMVWFIWCFSVHLWASFVPETNGTIYHLAATSGYWFCILIGPFIALFRDAAWKFAKRVYFPEPYHLVQEAIHHDIPLEDVDLDYIQRKGALRRAIFAKAARAAAFSKDLMGQGYAYDGPAEPPR